MFRFSYDNFTFYSCKKKDTKIETEEIKWSLHADIMTLYVENAKESSTIRTVQLLA